MIEKILINKVLLMRYHFSPFVFLYKRKGVYCLYHSLTMNKIYFESIDWIDEKLDNTVDITSLNNNEISFALELIKQGFLVDESFNADKYLEDFSKKYEKINISVLTLLVTTDCNFRCRYCFFENSEKVIENKEVMSFKVAKKAIDLFFNLSKKGNRKVILYGGEPLLNLDVVKKIINYLRSLDKSCSISINTNGSLIDNELAEFFRDKNVALGISLDGDREINDRVRIDSGFKSTYDRTLNAINICKQKGVKFGISCTLGKHNKNEIENLPIFFKKIGAKSFGFNIPSPVPNYENPFDVSIEEIADKMIRANEVSERIGIIETRLGKRRISKFRKGIFYAKDCAAYGHMLVAAPDGTFGPCHHFYSIGINFIKADSSEDILNSEVFKKWSKRFPLKMEECKYCEAIGICGGGCAYRSYLKKGSIEEIDVDTCFISKKLLEYLIWDYFDKFIKRAWENETIE